MAAAPGSSQSGLRGTRTNLKEGGLATKDGNLSLTDGGCEHHTVHNGTFLAFAHFNTRTHIHHAASHSNCVAHVEHRHNFNCGCRKRKSSEVTAVCIHRLLEWTHPRTTQAPCTRTTLSISTITRSQSEVAMTRHGPSV